MKVKAIKILSDTVFILLLLCLCSTEISAQNIPDGYNIPPAPLLGSQINPVPPAYPGVTQVNSIIEWSVTKPQISANTIVDPATLVQDVKQTTQYIDGLGRTVQTVAKQASPLGFDMVTPVVYDQYGRESIKYLPYTSPGNDGSFKINAFNEQQNFSFNQYPDEFFVGSQNIYQTGELFFYGQTNYEPSPLNRVTKTMAPGNSWVGSGTGTTVQYFNNTAADSVVIWNIDFISGDLPVSGGYYNNGTLSKSVTTDENGNQAVEYKDMQGHTILKKVQGASVISTGYTGWLCTYYVYDDTGNLRFVIQPQGTAYLVSNNWAFDNNATTWVTSTIAQQQCFSYEYDPLNRMIIKRVPATGEVWMVYDARDRLVMSQDVNQRALGKWLYTNYDSLNRVILTGLWTNSGNQSYQQSQAGGVTNYPNPTSNNEVLTQTFYDDYSKIAGTGSGLASSIVTTNITNTVYFYAPSNTVFPYPQAIIANYQINNQVTGTVTEVPGTGTYLYDVNFYDDRYRVVQKESTNYSGALDTVDMQYSFSGQVLRKFECLGKGGNNPQHYRIDNYYGYDAMGRVLTDKMYVGNNFGSSPMTTISQNSYNELGQLKEKYIGQQRNISIVQSYSGPPLDSIFYNYNIRGWLNGINKNYADSVLGTQGWFGEDISYDAGFSQNQLNGNIAGVRWRSGGDAYQRAYGYSYDNANRLLEADFTQYTNSAWSTGAGLDFSTSNLSYDLNGNILSMNKMGNTAPNTSTLIDQLQYGYNPNSNQLNYVTDLVNDPTSTLGDFKEINNNTSQDYTYDGNGNLTEDNNKAISSIAYNYLNLPQTVTVTNKGTITYTYDAAGNKLRKVTVDNTVTPAKTTKTDYLDEFVYQNDTLQYVSQPEGRIIPQTPGSADTMYYQYFEKDHLGDTRAVLTDQRQRNIYPTATMEPSKEASDTLYYDNINTSRTAISSIAGYPTPTDTTYGNPNQYVAVTNGTSNPIGPSITMRVMAGDLISMHVADWYNMTGTSPNSPVSPLPEMLTALMNSVPLVATGNVQGFLQAGQVTSQVLTPGITNFLNNQSSQSNSAKPQAFLNWVLFDDQFNVVMTNDGNNSGFKQATEYSTAAPYTITESNILMTKCGYLYVYLNNETPNVNVYFDNFQVTDARGPLVETDNYYPFGLSMAGIDDQAAGNLDNLHKFNKGSELQHKEFSDGSGLELYDTHFRQLDPQLGRWWQIDPKPDYAQSLYSAMDNNPILRNDPVGDTPRAYIPPPKNFNSSDHTSVSTRNNYKPGVPMSKGDDGPLITITGSIGPQAGVSIGKVDLDVNFGSTEFYKATEMGNQPTDPNVETKGFSIGVEDIASADETVTTKTETVPAPIGQFAVPSQNTTQVDEKNITLGAFNAKNIVTTQQTGLLAPTTVDNHGGTHLSNAGVLTFSLSFVVKFEVKIDVVKLFSQ
jgi:RHS repeat-associated protein